MRIIYLTGGLAQLGERLAGSQKVIGSIPLSSTFLKTRSHCNIGGDRFFLRGTLTQECNPRA